MQTDIGKASDKIEANVAVNALNNEELKAHGHYLVECVGPDGQVKWTDTIDNLIVTTGRNDILDKYLAGSGYTAAVYLGLIDNASYSAVAAADTMASHAGWLESTAYSNANRPTPTFNAASAGSKATTATAFTINAAATLKGVFLTTNNTKAGTSGILISGGAFASNRGVDNGDTLNVTYTMALTSS